jgi:hypothetical protein
MKFCSLHGPTNSLSEDSLESRNFEGCFLYVNDIFSSDIIIDFCKNHGKPSVVMSDHMTLHHTLPPDIDGIFLPLFAASQVMLWCHDDFINKMPITQANFCVMANKKTLSRSLCLRMIEIMGFSNFLYTWSGFGRSNDMSLIVEELDLLGQDSPISADQRASLLCPISMPRHFIGAETAEILQDICVVYSTNNRISWDQGLDRMFTNSAVGIITETYVPKKESVFTEKTVYSVLGLNFPIWVGGFAQAQHWKTFGFDIFEDVIDHSYQYKDTLVERCWHALDLNKRILSDFDYAKSIRESCMDRLIANRARLLSGQLMDYCIKHCDQLPEEQQTHVRSVLKQSIKHKVDVNWSGQQANK